MFKRNSSLPAMPVLGSTRQRSSSVPEIRYSKTSKENIEIRWVDVQSDAEIHLTDKQNNDATSIAETCRKISPETIHENLNNAVSQSEYDVGESFNVININENKGMTSASETSPKAFDTASDADIKRKGMVKGHYVDKNVRKRCYGCQKQFKLKRKPRHCRRCGEVFCIKCVKYRRKLNFMAHPDPEGKLRKVCKACFEEDSLVLGCTRNLTKEFSSERTFARYAKIMSKRANSLTTTFWPDQIDRREECLRLITGFRQDVKQLGTLDVLILKLITPAWQKSKYWDYEIQATRCRSCKGDIGLRKSTGNCRVCGLALCKNCSHRELLLFYDNGDTFGEVKIAIINAPGGPLHEPDISLLLYVCLDCKTYISEQQTSDLVWYQLNVEKNLVDDMRDFDIKFEELRTKAEASVIKIEELLDKAVGSDLPTTDRRSAATETTTLRTTLIDYEKEFKTIRSWLDQPMTRTEANLLNNYIKCKYDNFMECRYKCRVLGNKLDAMEHRHNRASGNNVDAITNRNDA